MGKRMDTVVVYAGRAVLDNRRVRLVARRYIEVEGDEVSTQIQFLRGQEGTADRHAQLGLCEIAAVWVMPAQQYDEIKMRVPSEVNSVRDFAEYIHRTRGSTPKVEKLKG